MALVSFAVWSQQHPKPAMSIIGYLLIRQGACQDYQQGQECECPSKVLRTRRESGGQCWAMPQVLKGNSDDILALGFLRGYNQSSQH